jgi:hypothetical protein
MTNGNPVPPTPPLKSYADVQAFITDWLKTWGEYTAAQQAPHSDFWASLSYQDFTTGNVPNVTDSNGNPVKILKVGDSANSTIIMALLGTGPFASGNPNGWVQMPAFQSTMFSATQVSALAAWIDLGCPE